jgi:pimeloyl-ACP methyl ester carboxylesterase
LVFLHYWGGSRRTWSEVIGRLSDRFRCVAVDLRGWGKSDHHAEDYSLSPQADLLHFGPEYAAQAIDIIGSGGQESQKCSATFPLISFDF